MTDGPAEPSGIAQSDNRRVWRRLPAGIWALGFVSLLMDVLSEMIHALLPVYLVVGLGGTVCERIAAGRPGARHKL